MTHRPLARSDDRHAAGSTPAGPRRVGSVRIDRHRPGGDRRPDRAPTRSRGCSTDGRCAAARSSASTHGPRRRRARSSTLAASPYAAAKIARSEARSRSRRRHAPISPSSSPAARAFRFGDLDIRGLVALPAVAGAQLQHASARATPTRADELDHVRAAAERHRATSRACRRRSTPTRARPSDATVDVAVIEAPDQAPRGRRSATRPTPSSARNATYRDVNVDGRGLADAASTARARNRRSSRVTLRFARPPTEGGWIDTYGARRRAHRHREPRHARPRRSRACAARHRGARRSRASAPASITTSSSRRRRRRRRTRSTSTASGHWRRVDDLLAPTQGWMANCEVGGGVPGASTRALRPRASARRTRVACRSGADAAQRCAPKAGAVIADSRDGIPSTLLFRTGGDTTVRGYAFESLGVQDGDAIVGGRYYARGQRRGDPLDRRRRGASRRSSTPATRSTRRRIVRLALGYGVGARVRTPIGPFRLDVAYGAGRAQRAPALLGGTRVLMAGTDPPRRRRATHPPAATRVRRAPARRWLLRAAARRRRRRASRRSAPARCSSRRRRACASSSREVVAASAGTPRPSTASRVRCSARSARATHRLARAGGDARRARTSRVDWSPLGAVVAPVVDPRAGRAADRDRDEPSSGAAAAAGVAGAAARGRRSTASPSGELDWRVGAAAAGDVAAWRSATPAAPARTPSARCGSRTTSGTLTGDVDACAPPRRSRSRATLAFAGDGALAGVARARDVRRDARRTIAVGADGTRRAARLALAGTVTPFAEHALGPTRLDLAGLDLAAIRRRVRRATSLAAHVDTGRPGRRADGNRRASTTGCPDRSTSRGCRSPRGSARFRRDGDALVLDDLGRSCRAAAARPARGTVGIAGRRRRRAPSLELALAADRPRARARGAGADAARGRVTLRVARRRAARRRTDDRRRRSRARLRGAIADGRLDLDAASARAPGAAAGRQRPIAIRRPPRVRASTERASSFDPSRFGAYPQASLDGRSSSRRAGPRRGAVDGERRARRGQPARSACPCADTRAPTRPPRATPASTPTCVAGRNRVTLRATPARRRPAGMAVDCGRAGRSSRRCCPRGTPPLAGAVAARGTLAGLPCAGSPDAGQATSRPRRPGSGSARCPSPGSRSRPAPPPGSRSVAALGAHVGARRRRDAA